MGYEKTTGKPWRRAWSPWFAVSASLAVLVWGAACQRPASGTVLMNESYSLIGHFSGTVVETGSLEHEPVQLRLVTAGGVQRPAILAHAPSQLRFKAIRIGRETSLRFGMGLDDFALARAPGSNGVRFVVEVADPEGRLWRLSSVELRPAERPADRGWHDVEIDLDRFVGWTVDLLLHTEDRDDPRGDWAAWSNPVIESSGERVDPSTIPVLRKTVARDLLEEFSPGDTEGAQSCRLRFRIDLPEDTVLDFAGQLLRDPEAPPAPLGPVRIGVRLDGRSLYEREVTTSESIITIADTVPLDRTGGREVNLEVEMCDVGAGNTLLWARRIWLTGVTHVPRARSESGPNLLLLMVDTLRADHLSLYGYGRETSPALDRLARESVVFDRAVSPSSWTLPSVASLLTGSTPLEHGVIEGVPLGTPVTTIAEVLEDAGFTTFGFSANPIVGKLEAMNRGFETFSQIPWSRAEQVNRLFLDWLADNHDLRWFAYLHYIDPHSPYAAPLPWFDRYTDGCRTPYTRGPDLQKLSDTVNFGQGDAAYGQRDVDCLLAGYDGEIRYWDDQLTALLAELEKLDQLDNTIIVVTSDHGEEFLEHGSLGHGYHLYEESIHVPLLFRAPGLLGPGRREDLVETRTIKEAVLALLGVSSTGADGGPLVVGESRREPLAFSHTTEAYRIGEGYTVLAAVRDARFKYILCPADGAGELFDLDGDPQERVDRSELEPEISARYHGVVEGWLENAQAHTVRTRGMDLETLEKLRALGYIR